MIKKIKFYFYVCTIQLYFQLAFLAKILWLQRFSKNLSLTNLARDGVVVFEDFISPSEIQKALEAEGFGHLTGDLSNEKDFQNVGQYFSCRSIEKLLLKKLSEKSPFSNDIRTILRKYIGKRYLSYDKGIRVLPRDEIKGESMQPHHDSKKNRLIVYLWLSPKSRNRHPLYYLTKSHKVPKIWFNYKMTRVLSLPRKNMMALYPDLGDLIIFDSHGIHSHFKEYGLPRAVYSMNFDPVYSKRQVETLKKNLSAQEISIGDVLNYDI